MSDESNSVIVWYEMLWRTIVIFPIFSSIQDLMKISFVYRWDQADFHSDYVTWLLHLSYYDYKNLVVTMPFWVWGPLGLASMQLLVFSWIGVLFHVLHFCVCMDDTRQKFSFCFSELRYMYSPWDFNQRKACQHLANCTRWWLLKQCKFTS